MTTVPHAASIAPKPDPAADRPKGEAASPIPARTGADGGDPVPRFRAGAAPIPLALAAASIIAGSFPLVLVRFGGLVAGILGLFLTASVHQWAGGIFDVLLVMTGAAVLLAALVLHWFTALLER